MGAAPIAGCENHIIFAAQCSPVGNISKNPRQVFETRRYARLYRSMVRVFMRRAGMHVSTPDLRIKVGY